MANKNITSGSFDDIDSILSTINALVSHTGIDVAPPKEEPILAPRTLSDLENLKGQGFGEAQIAEIKKGLEQQLPVEVYARPCYDWMQMNEIRKGLMDNLDTQVYENPLYSANQMREIRLGLVDHLNVATYAKLILSATDMNRIRKVLFSESYNQNPRNFGQTITDEDTGISIIISDDCMEAHMDISQSEEAYFSVSRLTQILKDHGITYGIQKQNLEMLSGKEPTRLETCVAMGKKPEVGKSGWYELFFQNVIDNYKIIAPDDVIDYSAVNTITSVVPGKILARYHSAQQDTEGCTVTGILIEGKKGENLPPLTGKGFKFDDAHNVYFAATKGYVTYNATTYTLNVENIYELYGDVNYYKNFEYDGTVYIHGSLCSRAVIQATGNVIIDGFVEDAEIIAGQNVVLKGGCNGGDRGAFIESGGSVRGKFFENVTINAKGLIEGNYFLNCNIRTDNKLIARSKKARIMGGDILAAIAVETAIIGNYRNTKTYCTVGELSGIQNQLARLHGQKRDTKDQIKALNEGKLRLLSLLGAASIDGNELYEKTCKALDIKENELAQLRRESERLTQVSKRAKYAYVKIFSQVREGVVFNICGKLKKSEDFSSRGPVLLSRDNIKKGGKS